MNGQVFARNVVYARNPRQVYVDALNGSDTEGTGALLQPFQTIEVALAAIVALPADQYLLVLAPGSYGAAPIAWPVSAGKNISALGSGDAAIVQPITYTAIGGVTEESVFFQNLGINDITVDLTAAAGKVAQILFNQCGLGLNRIDSLPPGPQVVRVTDSFISTISTNATVICSNAQWIGGPANNIGATGQLLIQGGLAAAMVYNIAAGGQMLLQSCIASFSTFTVDGTLSMLDVVSPGSTISGPGTLVSDAVSLSYAPTVTVATTTLADNAQYEGYNPATPADWAVVPDDVAEALDSLAASTGNFQARTSYIFQPGGVAGGNTYTTWADLYAALQVNAGPKTIYFDDSIVTPAVIPAGVYALPETAFDNARMGQSCAVEVSNGVSWTGLTAINNVEIDFLNSAIVESLGQRAIFFEGATINALGTAPIWEVPAGAQFQCFKGTFFNAIPGAPVVDVLAGQTFILVLGLNSSTNTNDCIAGTLTSSLLVFKDASGVFSTQTTFAGAQSETLVDNSGNVAYTPAVAGDWAAPIPTQVADALNKTSAQISQLNPKQVWVDIVKGSDVTGTGSQLRPFASLPATLAYIATQGAGSYLIEMGPGLYTGAPIAWPNGSGGESVSINGTLEATTIGHAITMTAAAVPNFSFVSTGAGYSTPVVIDMALASAAQIRFLDSGIQVQRIDSNPAAVMAIIGCGINSLDVTGPNNNVQSSFGVGPITVQAASSLRISDTLIVFGSVNAIGTLTVIDTSSSIALAGAGTVQYDATSRKLITDAGGSITAATQVLLDDAESIAYSPAVPADWSPVPNEVKEALDQLAASPNQAQTNYVFQPSGTAGGNTYTTWASLYAALVANAGPKVIYFDASFATPTIPAGAYALEECVFDNAYPGDLVQVNVASGVTWTGLQGVRNLLLATQQTAIIQTVASLKFFLVNASIINQGTGPAFEFTSNASLVVSTLYNRVLNGNGAGNPVINVPAGQAISLNLAGLFDANASAIEGTLTSTLQVLFLDSSNTTFATQTGFAGTVNLALEAIATRTSYSPTTPADWVVAPATTQNALDQLAAAVLVTGTVSGPQAAAKQIDLGVLVNHATVVFLIQGLGAPVQTFDYSLVDGATTVIDWTGLGLDGVIVGGENYSVQYRA